MNISTGVALFHLEDHTASKMTTPAYDETPTTNGNGHIDADEDITMDTGEEEATNANTNMEIDAHVLTQSTIRESLHHRYPKLIAEIWKRVCTAYSRVPGVHIFSLEEPQRRVENNFTPRWMPLGPPRLGPRDGGYGWYFRNANVTAPSFDAHNPSTYLIDSGLWTACQQSRSIMRDAYGFDSWNRIIASHPDLFNNELKRQSLMDFPVCAHFRDLGKDRIFGLFPNKDLIFLQSTKI